MLRVVLWIESWPVLLWPNIFTCEQMKCCKWFRESRVGPFYCGQSCLLATKWNVASVFCKSGFGLFHYGRIWFTQEDSVCMAKWGGPDTAGHLATSWWRATIQMKVVRELVWNRSCSILLWPKESHARVDSFCCDQKGNHVKVGPFIVAKAKSCKSWSFCCDQRKVMENWSFCCGQRKVIAMLPLAWLELQGKTQASEVDRMVEGRLKCQK